MPKFSGKLKKDRKRKRVDAIMRRRSGNSTKKPITKRPWFWPVVALVAVGAIFGSGDDKEEPQYEPIPPTKNVVIVPKSITDDDKSTPSQNVNSYSKPTMEELQENASTYLSEQFQMEVVSLVDRTLRYEITVTAAGISDREDQSEAPENWEDFQIDFISAQARTSDELGISSKNTMLCLVDSAGEVMLSARNGIIIDNRYKEKVVPPPSDTQSNELKVWVTSSGKKYHYSSSCSNMNNPKSISISEARARGYTACDKCA